MAVEVAPIGQVAGLLDETEDVDDRDGQNTPREPLRLEALEHSVDDLHAVDLVAVDGGVEPEGGPGLGSVNGHHRNRQPITGWQAPRRQLESLARAGRDHGATDAKFAATL